ncbi:hypothetical protein [Streptomyces sp. NPDC096012]|uniref:hypothetical protein n=1 Tax=Streptomyces sp. NPDC096012 TaxID=3155684 RepID=UPI003369E6E9
MENSSPLPPNVPPRPSSAPTVRTTADSTESPDGWRDEYEADPEYQAILARMENPWWKRPVALAGGVVVIVVASFFLGFSSGGGGGSDSLTAAEQGKADAQRIVRTHANDVTLSYSSPEFDCHVAENGVGFINLYTDAQVQEYMAACEQEFAALTHQ